MSEAESAEFGSMARWTAQVAMELGAEYFVPAGCRGSGSPAALDWLLNELDLSVDGSLLDCGAGVGGPAAYAAEARSVRPVLVEPEGDACWAAKTLFGHPVIQASGSALPVADSSVDAARALGVLCTTTDQLELLAELRRVVRPGGSIGLLVFVARGPVPCGTLPDNDFPTPDRLEHLILDAALRVERRLETSALPAIPDAWTRRVDTVSDVLAERYSCARAWQLAEQRSAAIGELLEAGVLTGELLVLRHA